MIFTVDAEIQRKGGAFVMPELYGAALCVHLPEGLHGNLWVNQCEIHQNPPSVKRQSGITAPLRVAFIPFVV